MTGPACPLSNLKQTSGRELLSVVATTVLPVVQICAANARAGFLLMERGVTTWSRSLRRITAPVDGPAGCDPVVIHRPPPPPAMELMVTPAPGSNTGPRGPER